MTNQRNFIVFAYYYLPVILWMGLIFYLSSIPGLRSGSESISIEIFLRKSAHTLEYFILVFLFWRIFHFCWNFSFFKASVFSLIFCFLYAISDEIHQFFIQDRAGRALDVLIDMMGGLLGALFSIPISKIKKNK